MHSARAQPWGFSLALTSPTSILWFAAVGGSVIAELGRARSELIPFAGGFFAVGLTWSAGLAAAAATLRHLGGRKLSNQRTRASVRASARSVRPAPTGRSATSVRIAAGASNGVRCGPSATGPGDNYLGVYPASSKLRHRPVDAAAHAALAARLRDIPPEKR